ncbi:Nif3-like dinuclear metal center hexameric protein [Nocardioides sp. 616]|uniref:Nif3-like dinuclear metal center hexameric protein n=1 Tax=Nocardioides sp. 616 TaxID=2268090 RepID=UPI000CE336EF|nr:Nif3-like dinuclear metal center hexameric protein [Nocardioides sp. 616]
MPLLREVVSQVHAWYPPATAESWDAVGLVLGDPESRVGKVLFAVDPTLEVAREAAEWGADLLVVHHPLFLKPVHGFSATTTKGRTAHVLTTAGCALLTAHTNADQAVGGVSESLATALGLHDLSPLVPGAGMELDVLAVHVPTRDAEAVREVLAAAGAGALGDYDRCSFSVPGRGRFRPLEGARPAVGSPGRLEEVVEERIEVVVPRERRAQVLRALLAAHPYEEPSYHVTEMADPGSRTTGTGRVGEVAPTTLEEFARAVADALPATAHGVRVAGDPRRPVRRVAVVGGAGDFLLDRVAGEEVDVYVTSDLRHHPASEFAEKNGPALLDIAHWAAEWTWLPVVEAMVARQWSDTVETRVSTICTDPWTFRV